MAFGLRNVTDKQRALDAIYRTVKPGGRLLVLEFSKPVAALKPAYDFYSFNILPKLGRLLAKDEASYRYLAESIRRHPDQQTLKAMLEQAGFKVEYIRHRYSMSLYKQAYKRAESMGILADGLPTEEADIRTWLEKECAAPRGELLLALALKD